MVKDTDGIMNLAPGLVLIEDGSLITERIPVTLMQRYMNKGHHLFIDNIYTSIPLAKHLLDNGTHVTGTIENNFQSN